MADVGTTFVRALAGKDRDTLSSLFASSVEFRGLTPGGFWEASTAAEVIDVLFGHWFEDHDQIEELVELEGGRHVDRHRVDYCLRVLSRDDLCLVEQRGYFDLDDEQRIVKMSLICSGFRPIAA